MGGVGGKGGEEAGGSPRAGSATPRANRLGCGAGQVTAQRIETLYSTWGGEGQGHTRGEGGEAGQGGGGGVGGGVGADVFELLLLHCVFDGEVEDGVGMEGVLDDRHHVLRLRLRQLHRRRRREELREEEGGGGVVCVCLRACACATERQRHARAGSAPPASRSRLSPGAPHPSLLTVPRRAGLGGPDRTPTPTPKHTHTHARTRTHTQHNTTHTSISTHTHTHTHIRTHKHKHVFARTHERTHHTHKSTPARARRGPFRRRQTVGCR